MQSELPNIPGFTVWKSERDGCAKGGGGLSLLYKPHLKAHEWNPPVPIHKQYIEKERQWLLIDNGERHFATLHC